MPTTHIPMTLFRGLADDLPLHTWLEQHVWPAEHRFINPETVRWASRLGVAENYCVPGGLRSCAICIFMEDEVAAMVDSLGMRGVLANAHFDVTDCHQQRPHPGRGRTVSLRAGTVTPVSYRRWDPTRLTPWGLSFTVACTRWRERLDTLVVTHLAGDSGRRSRHSPPLRSLADPPPGEPRSRGQRRLVAAHCVWIDGEEIDPL